jgi:hypothetical protein
MNLLAKRAGQLLLGAVLFFLSCEDDSFLLGIKGKTKFQGRYHEITFSGDKSSVLLLDSVATDQFDISSTDFETYRFLIGEYNDPAFGMVRAESFAQFQPDNSPFSPPYFNSKGETLTYMYTTIDLLVDHDYTYGSPFNVDYDELVNVYDLTDTLSFYERYYSNSTHSYSATPIAQLAFKVKWILFEDVGHPNFFLSGRVDDEYGFRIFDYAGSKGDSALVGDNLEDFRKMFYGLAFIPTQTSNRIIGYNVSLLSKLSIHYRTATSTDTLSTDFYFYPFPYISSNSFSNITTQRTTGGLVGISTPDQPFYPYNDPASTERYIQDGSVVITELNLSDYYSLIDTLEDIVINSAEISLGLETPPEGMAPPPDLYGVLMKEKDGKIVPYDMNDKTDSLKLTKLAGNIFTDIRNFAISTELSSASPLVLEYDDDSNRYVGYATMFFQALFNTKDNPDQRIEHLGLFPVTAPTKRAITPTRVVDVLLGGLGNSVNRAVLKTDNMKLKIYYTVPNKPNLE